jgi:hypothetical protein
VNLSAPLSGFRLARRMFLVFLQRPQKVSEFSYIAGYSIAPLWHCECIKAIQDREKR